MVLEATMEPEQVDDCLDYLTPKWLQSLVLYGESVVAAGPVADSLREDPDRCLKLLQVCWERVRCSVACLDCVSYTSWH